MTKTTVHTAPQVPCCPRCLRPWPRVIFPDHPEDGYRCGHCRAIFDLPSYRYLYLHTNQAGDPGDTE